MTPLRVTIVGAIGRMGSELFQCISEAEDLDFSGLVVEPGSPMVGMVPPTGIKLPYVDHIEQAVETADVLIDFTAPTALTGLLAAAEAHGIPLVSGTTGFRASQMNALRNAAESIPLFYSPNMSVGIHVMLELVKLAASALGFEYDIELVESHHRFKKDAPSGTALRLLSALQGVRLERSRDMGGTSESDTDTDIAVHSIRGGDVVGDHSVHFMGLGDRIEITHRATSRRTFALGALRAARWLVRQPPGFYSMTDLLSSP